MFYTDSNEIMFLIIGSTDSRPLFPACTSDNMSCTKKTCEPFGCLLAASIILPTCMQGVCARLGEPLNVECWNTFLRLWTMIGGCDCSLCPHQHQLDTCMTSEFVLYSVKLQSLI